MSKPKLTALLVLALLTFAVPLVEGTITGSSGDGYSSWDVAGSFLALLPLYWWYHVDKQERGYRAGRLMNVAIVGAAIVALPVYLIRSRGWRNGIKANAMAAAGLGVLYLVEMLGETIGQALYERGVW